MFSDELDNTMEAYIDDLLVKSRNETNHVINLTTTFGILRHFIMRLNLLKCIFVVFA